MRTILILLTLTSVQEMELELKKLEDTVKSIHDEMFYLRSRYKNSGSFSVSTLFWRLIKCENFFLGCFREEEMQELNRATNSRMAWLSFLSLGVCIAVAGLQLWHLKTFFERKKLL